MHNELIGNALAYIEREWKNEGLTLEKIAGEAGFSLSYFDRLFARHMGKGVMEYVRTLKLIRSAGMLRTGNRSVLDIALEIGYASPENYARAFHALYGMSPSDYREKHRGVSVTWKDRSTGAAVRLFEAACPELKRIDTDEAIDTLMSKEPLLYFPACFMLTQTDCAVYTLDDTTAESFIAVCEYRPEETTLEILCPPARAQDCLAFAGRFPNVAAGFTCPPDFDAVAAGLRLPGFQCRVFENYVYREEDIAVPLGDEYAVRPLNADDAESVRKLSCRVDFPLKEIFRQRFEFGNLAAVDFLGLFREGRLVGCATPSIESVRGYLLSDIGDIAVADESLRQPLWAAAIQYALRRGARPVVIGATPEPEGTGAQEARRMGYALFSRKLQYAKRPAE